MKVLGRIILQKGRKAFTIQCSASPSFYWKEKVKRIKNQYEIAQVLNYYLLAESRNSTQKAYKRLLDWVKFIKKTYSDFHFLGFQFIQKPKIKSASFTIQWFLVMYFLNVSGYSRQNNILSVVTKEMFNSMRMESKLQILKGSRGLVLLYYVFFQSWCFL